MRWPGTNGSAPHPQAGTRGLDLGRSNDARSAGIFHAADCRCEDRGGRRGAVLSDPGAGTRGAGERPNVTTTRRAGGGGSSPPTATRGWNGGGARGGGGGPPARRGPRPKPGPLLSLRNGP